MDKGIGSAQSRIFDFQKVLYLGSGKDGRGQRRKGVTKKKA
jgi:hypothetical protein